jgi:hypothetical protein
MEIPILAPTQSGRRNGFVDSVAANRRQEPAYSRLSSGSLALVMTGSFERSSVAVVRFGENRSVQAFFGLGEAGLS